MAERDRFDKQLRFAYAVLVAVTVIVLGAITAVVLVARFAGDWPTGIGIGAVMTLVVALSRWHSRWVK